MKGKEVEWVMKIKKILSESGGGGGCMDTQREEGWEQGAGRKGERVKMKIEPDTEQGIWLFNRVGED